MGRLQDNIKFLAKAEDILLSKFILNCVTTRASNDAEKSPDAVKSYPIIWTSEEQKKMLAVSRMQGVVVVEELKKTRTDDDVDNMIDQATRDN